MFLQFFAAINREKLQQNLNLISCYGLTRYFKRLERRMLTLKRAVKNGSYDGAVIHTCYPIQVQFLEHASRRQIFGMYKIYRCYYVLLVLVQLRVRMNIIISKSIKDTYVRHLN